MRVRVVCLNCVRVLCARLFCACARYVLVLKSSVSCVRVLCACLFVRVRVMCLNTFVCEFCA